MTATNTPDAIKLCEQQLHLEITYNEERKIAGSQSAVARRLLGRRQELANPFRELCDALGSSPHAIREFLKVFLYTAAHWNPAKLNAARLAQKRLAELNRKIEKNASSLARLIEERDLLGNREAFHSDSHHSVASVIEAASVENDEFQRYLREEFEDFCSRHKLSRWPSIAQFVGELSADAKRSRVRGSDPLTVAGTTGERVSNADFARILQHAFERHPALPQNFWLTDETMASFITCALGLEGTIVSADSLKSVRARAKKF